MQICEKLCKKLFHVHSDNDADPVAEVQNVQLIRKVNSDADELDTKYSTPPIPKVTLSQSTPTPSISSKNQVDTTDTDQNKQKEDDSPPHPSSTDSNLKSDLETEPQKESEPKPTTSEAKMEEEVIIHKEPNNSEETEKDVLDELDDAIAQSDDIVLEMKDEEMVDLKEHKIVTEKQEMEKKEKEEDEEDEDDDDDDEDEEIDDDDNDNDECMDKNSKRLANKYGDLGGELLILYIPNPRLSKCTFGLRLSGNKDLNRMSIFICQIVQGSLADIDGRLQIGDEILEIDDHILYGRSHVNASPVIKASGEKMIKFVIHRSSKWHDEMAIPVVYKYAEELMSNPSSRRSSVLEILSNTTNNNNNESNRKLSSISLGQIPSGSSISTEETHIIYLNKGPQGLGFAIMEGSFTNEPGIYIKHLAPMGPAAKDGSLRPGDKMMSINNQDVSNASYDTVLELLRNARGQVRLVVSRVRCATVTSPIPNNGNESDPPMSGGLSPLGIEGKRGDHYKKRLSAPNISIGAIGFVRSRSPTIVEETGASMSGGAGNGSGELLIPAITTVRTADSKLHKPESSPNKISIKVIPESESGLQNFAMSITECSSRRKSSIGNIAPSEGLVNVLFSNMHDDKQIDNIVINRNNRPLGMLIIGGSDTYIGDVVVHDIFPSGVIAEDGRVKVGDRIIMINGEPLMNKTHAEVMEMIHNTQAEINLKVRHHDTKNNSGVTVSKAIPNNDTTTGNDLSGNTSSRGSVSHTLPLYEDQDLYEEVTTVELVKRPSKGLGISVVGREGARGVYVCDIVKGGVADTDGRLRSGDQILEINGVDMRQAKQEEAATKLKCLMGNIILKIGRLQITRMRFTPSYLIPREEIDNGNDNKLQPKSLNNHLGRTHSPAGARSPLGSPAHAR